MQQGKPRWPMFHLVQNRAQRLDDMLSAAGINARIAVGVHGGDAFRNARAACIACAYSRECREWLGSGARGNGAPIPAALPEFCSNRAFIRICRTIALAKEPPRTS